MQPDNLLILLVFLGLILAYSGFLSLFINTGFAASQQTGFDFWGAVGFWADKIGGPGGVIVAIIIFIFTQRSDRKNSEEKERKRICNSCEALLREIDDHREAFTAYPKEQVTRGKDIHYISRILVSDAYASLLYSGLFTHFEVETQNKLSNLYLKIKIRNDAVNYLSKYYDTIFLGDSFTQNSWEQKIRPHEVFLTTSQAEILEYLRGIEILIKRQKRKSKCDLVS